MSPGKMAAQVAHCTEVYWLHQLRRNAERNRKGDYISQVIINQEVYESYICGAIVKTVCEARNKSHLLKAKTIVEELGLVEGEDFGLIYDTCRTELIPEEEDGTTLTGIWFKPLPSDKAHEISRKYHLYM